MASPTLQDQMGAMALIDELRHRRMNVQQHMNLPLHRAEVATRIRDYYLNQNIVVGDDVIEAGVRAYFERRLRFDSPDLTGWRYRFADMWIHRRKLSGKMIRTMVYGVICVAGAVTTINVVSDHVARGRAEERQMVVQGHQALLAKIDAQEKATVAVIQRHTDMASAKRIGEEALSLINRARTSGNTVATLLSKVPEGIDGDAKDSSHRSISDATQLVERAALMTQQMESLAFAYKRLVRLENDPVYQRRKVQTPELVAASTAARDALKMALEDANAQSAAAAISLAGDVLSAARLKDAGTSASQQAADILAELQVMGLPSLAMARITGKVAAVASASSPEAASKIVGELERTLDYVRAPLRVELLNYRGGLTGNIHSTSGMPGSMFVLYAQMVDPSGKVYSVPDVVQDAAADSWAKSIGVEVEERFYNKIRKDKQEDGELKEPFIGTKPANSLDISFTTGVSKNPTIFYYGP